MTSQHDKPKRWQFGFGMMLGWVFALCIGFSLLAIGWRIVGAGWLTGCVIGIVAHFDNSRAKR
jgi:hypothetical protein